MNITDIATTIFELATNVEFIANLLLLTFVSLYAVFSLILALQIKRLTQTVKQKQFSPFFQFISFIHLLGAIILICVVAALI